MLQALRAIRERTSLFTGIRKLHIPNAGILDAMSENLLRATVVSASGNLAGLKHRAAQVPDTHQVVCGTGEVEYPVHLPNPAMTYFPQQRDRLQPPKTFFDALPLLLADGIARVARGACIDGAPASALIVLRHVGRHSQMAALGHEIRRVISLVPAPRTRFTQSCFVNPMTLEPPQNYYSFTTVERFPQDIRCPHRPFTHPQLFQNKREFVVPGGGVEPPRAEARRILSSESPKAVPTVNGSTFNVENGLSS
jgi:hypothetical protein